MKKKRLKIWRLKSLPYISTMKQAQTPNTMNVEHYDTLCEEFTKKQELLTAWLESSTEERKKLDSFESLKKEAQEALLNLESWINANA